MKKNITIISTICLFALLIMIIPFLNVKAEGNALSLEGVDVSEKSTSVGIEKLDLSNNDVDNTMFFNKVGDFINYEVTVKNNSEEDVTIKEIVDDNTSENIKYEYPDSSGKVIAAGATDSFHIKAIYVKAASSNNLTNNPVNFAVHYADGQVLPITVNANTADPILISILMFFLSVLVFVILFIRGKKYAHYSLLLALTISIAIPFTTKADSFLLNIKLNNEVKVKSVSHIKPGPEVCLLIHKLAANTNVIFEDYTIYEGTFRKVVKNNNFDNATNVLYLKKATEEQYNAVKNSFNDDNLISTADSEIPSYIWFDTNTIYYYSEADTIFLNSDSTYLFSWLTKLETLDLSGFNSSNVTNMESMFFELYSIQNIDLSKLYTGNVTNMRGLFAECYNLKSPDISSFDTRKVNNMSYMFLQCIHFGNANISKLDTSNVTNMEYMFARCMGYDYLNISHFNTSNVINMNHMFYDNLSDGTINLSGLDLSKVTDMSNMFAYCEGKEHIILDNVTTRDVVYMNSMFQGCLSLSSLNLRSFNTSNVIDMSDMFSEDYNLISIDMSSFDTRKVTNMARMFSGCEVLTNIDVSNFNTEKVTDMSSMFSNCRELTEIDISNFDTSSLTNNNYMFCDDKKIEKIYVSDSFNLEKVETSGYVFYDCTSLVGGAGTTFDSNHIDNQYAHIDEGPSNPGYFTKKEV